MQRFLQGRLDRWRRPAVTELQMIASPHIDRLSGLAGGYDALLCDAWGVIHDGVNLFAGVEEALSKFRDQSGPVLVLTNAPRPSAIIPPQLDRLGLSRSAYDSVVTSGDATRAEITKCVSAPGAPRAFRLGPEKDDALYDGVDIEFTPLEQAGFIICTGLFDDQLETPESYRSLLEEAAMRGLPMVCANPDIVVRWGGKLIYCAGALAQIYEQLGGAVVYGGKPHPPIYELALKEIARLAGQEVDRSRILVVGDGLQTDILGANQQFMDAVFVFGGGGVHQGEATTDAAKYVLKEAGVHAVAAMESLQW